MNTINKIKNYLTFETIFITTEYPIELEIFLPTQKIIMNIIEEETWLDIKLRLDAYCNKKIPLDCPICLKVDDIKDNLRRVSCIYCKNHWCCLCNLHMIYYTNTNTCPLCRFDFDDILPAFTVVTMNSELESH